MDSLCIFTGLLLLCSCGIVFDLLIDLRKPLLLETLDPKLRDESLNPEFSSRDFDLSCLVTIGVGSGDGQGVGRGEGISLIGDRHFP